MLLADSELEADFTVEPDITVGALKAEIAASEALGCLAVEAQTLTLNDTALADEATLADCGVEDGAVLILTVAQPVTNEGNEPPANEGNENPANEGDKKGSDEDDEKGSDEEGLVGKKGGRPGRNGESALDTVYVAYLDDESHKYITLEVAVDVANTSGGTVVLLADVELTQNLTVSNTCSRLTSTGTASPGRTAAT